MKDKFRDNITEVLEADGSLCKIHDHQVYDWDWNELGQELTEQEHGRGLLPSEVYKTNPEVITLDENGYSLIDYNTLLKD